MLLISLALLLWPERNVEDIFHSKSQVWTKDGYLAFESHFVSWDAEHYLFLSENGYKAGFGQCAFYPLYPLMIRGLTFVTRVNDVVVGMALSNFLSVLGFVLFSQMVARRFGKETASLALTLLLVFPGSLFFQFVYTESLFFLLLMLFWYGLERGQSPWIATAGFLLPLTRLVGVFCAFPLAWHVFFSTPPRWWTNLTKRPGLTGTLTRLIAPRKGECLFVLVNCGVWKRVLLVLTPLIGWGIYFILMWKWTGNPFEGFAAQKQFGAESVRNLFDPGGFLMKLMIPNQWHEYSGSILDRCMFIMLIYCFPLFWKLDRSWCVWAFFLGVVPAVSGGFTSYTRFLSVVFPFFIALAILLEQPGRRYVKWITLVVFAILHIVLAWRFLNYRWAG
jgi:hypothetical protein